MVGLATLFFAISPTLGEVKTIYVRADATATVSLPPYATHVYRPKDLVTDNSGIFRGSVKVTEQNGLPITGAIKYEVHKTTDAGSGIEAMTIYRSMGQ